MSLDAKNEIKDLVLLYCRAIDRVDMALLRSVYHADAKDHRTRFDGTVDGFMSYMANLLERYDGTLHIAANHLTTVQGDRAVAETYGIAVHWRNPYDDPSLNFSAGVRWVDRLERREQRWGIVERWAIREWTQSNAGQYAPTGASGPMRTRRTSDPLYEAAQGWLV